MELVIGLLVALFFFSLTFYLAVKKIINNGLAFILLFFSIFFGLSIVKHKTIKIKFKGIEVATAKKQINDTKNNAIIALEKEVNKQAESLTALTRDANVASSKIEKQKTEVNTLVKTAKALEVEITKRKEEALLLVKDTEKAKEEIRKLNLDAQSIALTLTKATYLTLSTKNELGSSARLKKVTQEIENDINELLPLVIPNQIERSQWVNDLKNILPPRN